MKRVSIFLLLGFSLFSCNNELKISVFEPLDEVVLTNQIKIDSNFKDFYQNIRLLIDSVFIPNESYPEFKTLQYNSLWEYEKELQSNFKALNEDKEIKSEWSNIYSDELKKFSQDSIKYLNYLSDNYYKNYVTVDAEKIYEKLDWTTFNTYVKLKFSPVNNHTIRKFGGYIYFIPIKEEYDTLSRLFTSFEKYSFFMFRGNENSPFTEYAITSSNSLDEIKELPIDIIKQKYNIVFYATELVIEDRYIDVLYENVPTDMKLFLIEKFTFPKASYIQENFNGSFLDFYNYISKIVKDDLIVKFPLESQFFNNGWEKYYK